MRFTHADGTTAASAVPVRLRVTDEEDFASDRRGAVLVPRATALFATDAAPLAAKGWLIVDGANIWRLETPVRDGRGVTRVDLERVA
jgi:hypothetical protein